MENNLRQCYNSLSVVGTLKSKEVTYKNINGEPTISVELVIASKDGDKVHENKVRLWAKNTSKLYASYVTIANEYKTMKDNGNDADRIRVTGSLEMTEYYSSNSGTIKTFNNLRGVFVNRLDEDLKDEVGAVVECIVTGISDEISKDGVPTGRKKVQLMTVGYNSSIHELQNVVVEKELAEEFVKMYPINSTGKLYLKINNYVLVEEKEVEQPKLGFGSTLSNMPDSVAKEYVNEIVIVGGDTPNVANRFTLEQINEIKKRRELAKLEKMNAASVPPSPPSGFGNAFGGFGQTDSTPSTFGGAIMDEDIPF